MSRLLQAFGLTACASDADLPCDLCGVQVMPGDGSRAFEFRVAGIVCRADLCARHADAAGLIAILRGDASLVDVVFGCALGDEHWDDVVLGLHALAAELEGESA